MRKIYCDVCRREIPRIPDVVVIDNPEIDADDTLDICSVCKDMIREYIKHLQDRYSSVKS